MIDRWVAYVRIVKLGRAESRPRRLTAMFTLNSSAALPAIPDAKDHWAVLIAGSSGYGNYRHQSDVCHAYQVLKAGGSR